MSPLLLCDGDGVCVFQHPANENMEGTGNPILPLPPRIVDLLHSIKLSLFSAAVTLLIRTESNNKGIE